MPTNRIKVIAAVLQRDGLFLVCRRPPHKSHGDLWEFPGGKIEPGETSLAAAKRELAEELQLAVTAIGRERFTIVDSDSRFEVTFVDVAADGQPRLIEHTALDWMKPADILQLPLAPSDRRFVEFLVAGT